MSTILDTTISALETLLALSIDDFCNFTKRNRALMERLMNYNQVLQTNRNNVSGNNAAYNGLSWVVNTDRQSPDYVKDIDYYTNYASSAINEATQSINSDSSATNYTNRNQLYAVKNNLYPDDLNIGSNFDVWITSNQRSLLYKTKKLFHDYKIKTLISRFSTRGNGDTSFDTSKDTFSEYGLSHGNGLLKKDAENGYSATAYNKNGYNNPYCRVWTHHYQYDQLNKLIRPFNNGDDDSDSTSLSDFHKWDNFSDSKDGNNNDTETKYGWKNGDVGWNLSVLGDNGFVNITPKYKGKGGSDNTHTKQCMFSIENLAWQGYDPYSFEKALSWEQRGPLGGRIMWFPPYGIQFNETTQASWTNHTFIGRGEDVYTYTNTTRTGNLSFMLVVDHPSIIDYVSWQKESSSKDNQIKDTDILRFFAGCDSDTLREYAKPMPLTDEYVEDTTDDDSYVTPILAPIPDETPISDDEPVDTVKEIHFYVFYPNNYSGYYDGLGEDVEAIAYLLDGEGTQKDTSNNDISLKFDDIDGSNGTGYEMDSAIRDAAVPIIGSKITWNTAYNNNITTYQYSTTKKWHYRIDGEYEIPKKYDKNRNCYDQTLILTTNYKDTECNGLNKDSSKVSSVMGDNDEGLYSFAEIASALMKEANRSSFISKHNITESTVEELIEIFENYTLYSVSAIGYSNSHGNNSDNSTNEDRNTLLAQQRATTVIKWITTYMADYAPDNDLSDCTTVTTENPNVKVASQNISDEIPKKYRSAKITMLFKKNEDVNVSETEQTITDSDGDTVQTSVQKYIGYTSAIDANGTEYFIGEDSNGNSTYWVEVTDGDNKGQLKRVNIVGNVVTEIDTTETQRATYDTSSGTSSGENNSIRYDKEYYFFKELERTSPIVYEKLLNKIQYFDPAYHSMTPEGFNARLTFLQQCTRQGNTIGASDDNTTATNLAFGKPPFCVLRLGDFYNQMIVIDNISINYESLWDLNPEGIGVQPMIANVNISFKFIGGGDLGGPIRRLQNAMTFNYYSNSRLYDNRADRIVYNWDDKTNGAIDHEVDTDKSYYYMPSMYNKDNN